MSNRFVVSRPLDYKPVQEPLELLKYAIDAKRKQMNFIDDTLNDLGVMKVQGVEGTGYQTEAAKVNQENQKKIDDVYNYIKANPNDYNGAEKIVRETARNVKRDFIVGKAAAINSATASINESIKEGMKNIGKEGGYSGEKFNIAKQNFMADNQDIGEYDPNLGRFTKGTAFVAPPKDPDYWKLTKEVIAATPELKNVQVRPGKSPDSFTYVDITTGLEAKLPETLKHNLDAQLRNDPSVREDINFNAKNIMRQLGIAPTDYNTLKVLQDKAYTEKSNAILGFGYTNTDQKMAYRDNFAARENYKHQLKLKENADLLGGLSAGTAGSADLGLNEISGKSIGMINTSTSNLAPNMGLGPMGLLTSLGRYNAYMKDSEDPVLSKPAYNNMKTTEAINKIFADQGVKINTNALQKVMTKGANLTIGQVLDGYNAELRRMNVALQSPNSPYRAKYAPFTDSDQGKKLTDLIGPNDHYTVEVSENGRVTKSASEYNWAKAKKDLGIITNSGNKDNFQLIGVAYPNDHSDKYGYVGYKDGKQITIYPTSDINSVSNNGVLRLHSLTKQARLEGYTPQYEIPAASNLISDIAYNLTKSKGKDGSENYDPKAVEALRAMYAAHAKDPNHFPQPSVVLEGVGNKEIGGTIVPTYKVSVHTTDAKGNPVLKEIGQADLTEDANTAYELSNSDIAKLAGNTKFHLDAKNRQVLEYTTIGGGY